MIDVGWPHQVAITAEQVLEATTHYLCEGLSLCPGSESFRYNDRDDVVFCFAVSEHAEKFAARFNGEIVDPKEWWRRPRFSRPRH